MGNEIKLGSLVRLGVSELQGTVIGVANYLEVPSSYLVRYNDKDGVPQETWYNSRQISFIE